jgi:hypothetical protein
MKPLPIAAYRPSAQIAIGALALAGIVEALYYAAHSLWLGISLTNPMPAYDQWSFVLDYFRYLDGHYRWLDLFAHHNEHPIMTTRLVLFADAIFFRMQGVFPVVLAYATLAAVSALVATLATYRSRWIDWAAAFLVGLGLLWSTCQWFSLNSPFQIGFPLLHLFALISLASLAFALARNSAAWLAIAAIADFLAVFSLGSGIFLIIPVTLIALWMRRSWTLFWCFVAAHAVWTILYFVGGVPNTAKYIAAPATFAKFFVWFLGNPFGSSAVPAGAFGFIWFLAVAAWLTWRSLRRRPSNDAACCVLMAVAAFIVVEAALVAYTREAFDINVRYTTPAVVFWAAMLAATWRIGAFYVRLPVIAIAMLLIFFANEPRYATYWRTHVQTLDRITREVKAGTFDPASVKGPLLARFAPDAIRRLDVLGIGPFSSPPGG